MYLKIFNFFITIFISTGISVSIFLFNKKKINKIGFAEIDDNSIFFNLNQSEKIIYFHEIDNFTLYSFKNGISLNIKFEKNKQFGIISNSIFSNPENFIHFCLELERKINNYKVDKNIQLIKDKSFLDKPWIYPFMVFFSIVIITILLIYTIKGKNNTASFFVVIGSLMTVWSMYLREKNNR